MAESGSENDPAHFADRTLDPTRASTFRERDYATFLKNFVAERKKKHPSYSYKVLCRAAGLNSPSLIGMVVKGQRLPSRAVLRKLNAAMRLSPAECDYIEALVEAQRARSPDDKARLETRLATLGTRFEPRSVGVDHFRFISDWYHLVVLELLNVKTFSEDPAWIAKRLNDRITPEQATDALARLQRLGLLGRGADGKLRYESNNYITTSKNVDEAIAKYHRQMADLAIEAFQRDSPADRNLAGTTFTIDSGRKDQAIQALKEFRVRFMNEFASTGGDEVYQINLHFFRLG